MVKAFSIRTPLQGELLDFVKSSGFEGNNSAVTELVRDLTCLLASYREEGVLLFPDVFVLPSVDLVASLSPGTQRVALGFETLSEAAEKILKDCANLAVRGWAVYVAISTEKQAQYGLFRSLMHSYSTSAEEAMTETSSPSPVLLIRNRGPLVVELRNAKKDTFTASFTSAPASESIFAEHVNTFASAVSQELTVEQCKEFKPYLIRFLMDTLQRCHGALLAAHLTPGGGQAPEALRDGVWFSQAIDLADALHTAIGSKDAQTLATLEAYEALVAGMVASDGVVVFGTRGNILAYRVFLKPSDEEKKDLPEKGGGRRRTYALMLHRLGPNLKAAFFRSQDGNTLCEKV
jgi:hypothetical protein